MAEQQQPRIYVRRNDMMYRITIATKNVWIERQTPHGENMAMSIPPEMLYAPEWGVWNLDVLEKALEEYERPIEDEGA